MSILRPADLYHVGLIVDDIDTAAQRLTAVNGYRWTKPLEAALAGTTAADGDYEGPFKFVYSLQAPHLELIQGVPGTIWAPVPGSVAHHFGYWVDDLAAAAAGLEAAGYRQEARPAGDELAMFAYYTDPAGVRIEIVDRALFPDWPGFLEMMKA
jgi:catechol 2,3-dioxygenase-like lactoylglutathione lyase family enzyme